MTMKYEDVGAITKNQARVAFESQDPHQIVQAMLSATYHESDWEWIQDWCLRFLESTTPDLRNTAIACLGHLARIHTTINKAKVLKALRSHLNDQELRGRIEDAIEDIEMYAGRQK